MRIFRRMIAAEAGIHKVPLESVHLHELGALDTIVDVAGVLLGLDLLEVKQVVCSPVSLGRATLTGAHGNMPLPAPATVALITEVASAHRPLPAMRLHAVGYGAGTRTTPEPNILRLFLGASPSTGV